jgi:pyruvate formate lyase activating enzyme
MKHTRRKFLRTGGATLCAFAAGALLPSCGLLDRLFSSPGDEFRITARHWERVEGRTVQCRLCPNECIIAPGERGRCRVRENRDGTLQSLVYSRIAAAHVDPIEKKPFNHFLPGSLAYSVATAGCCLSCRFCQNWQISQSRPEEIEAVRITPADLSARARGASAPVIAFTYNEPAVQFEYVLDASREAKSCNLRTAVISSGYINPAPLREMAPHLDAVKIDLKSFSETFYREICGGTLGAVLRTLETLKAAGPWLEIVVLIIPALNDSPGEIRDMARWIKRNLGNDVPVHFTRFHPMYLMRNVPPTPVATLERCREIAAAEGVRYSYVGNVPGHRWENTYCHSCGAVAVRRAGLFSTENLLRGGACPRCGTRIPGVWV